MDNQQGHIPSLEEAQVLHAQGNKLIQNGRLEEALMTFELALRLDPSFVSAYVEKGVVLLEFGLREEARAAFEQASQFDPPSAPACRDPTCGHGDDALKYRSERWGRLLCRRRWKTDPLRRLRFDPC